MAFVQVNAHVPGRRAVARGHWWHGLGADVYCQGTIRTGGLATESGGVLTLVPDDNPGKSYRLVDMFHVDQLPSSWVDTYRPKFGTTQRLSVSGALLTDGRILGQGFGHMGPNETYLQWGGTVIDPSCPAWINDPARCSAGLQCFDPMPAGSTTTTGTQPEAPKPAWDGAQDATIRYDASTGKVTVFGADGTAYVMDDARTPTAIASELKTTAPQGTMLVVTGHWDPAAGTVAVDDWYIKALGEGEKKYGITPQGTLGPQSPDYPSTDWPGGLPPTSSGGPETTSTTTTTTAQAGMGWLWGLGLLGALYAASRRKR